MRHEHTTNEATTMTTYYQATRAFGDANRAEHEKGFEVAVLTPNDPDAVDAEGKSPLFDEPVEQETFRGEGAAEKAIAWLIGRGCSAFEAARIVGTAARFLLAQSTGTGPTLAERILDTPMD